VLDLLFLVLVLRALWGSIAARSVLGIGTSLPALVVFGLESASGWYGRLFDQAGTSGVLLLVAFGPSSLPGTSPKIPLSRLFMAHPGASKLAVAAALLVPFVLLTRRAKSRPLVEASSVDHALSLRFLAAAAITAAMPCVFFFAEMLTPEP